MAEGRFVAYYRVSTAAQGRSGLGLDAQKKAVADFLNGGSWKVVAEFTEVESGKREANRPQLAAAFAACRARRATLVVAKLDRLSRNAAFLLTLQNAGVEFICADMPQANRLSVGIMAVVAQHEREAISDRTRRALAEAKARGVKLGGFRPGAGKHALAAQPAARAALIAKADAKAADLAPVIAELRAAGTTSLGRIAGALNAEGFKAPRGGRWQAAQIANLLRRLDGPAPAHAAAEGAGA